ncbi:LPS-assembly protein LptD [Bacteroides sp. 214]|uniref:putative LPS assembly protein LptD n=1 Tax=Bacteroides sp. 214 TaxID=2302935 RepID=UPI0013D848B3|nr:putative LPS assembly protein LptD [Bacteroides sp. 214]NDW11736.1 LPS-assembly protein LptD [Bacteroides sp. 214]
MKARTIISLVLLLLFLIFPDDAMAQRRRRGESFSDSPRELLNPTAPADSLSNDSIPLPAIPDSLAVSDSKKKDGLNAPVEYEANDSIVFTAGGYVHLYGSGKVNYEKIELTSEIISMNMDSSTVFARGVQDSIGNVTGTPVFKDGDTGYETKTMRYNFKSKRGYISNVVTQQGEGYVTGNNAKKGTNDELFMQHGRYTTCDHHDHPHFYLQMTRAKVRPKKNVVTGPAYLVVEDVPLPFAVPFFFFPFNSSYSSGFIMPTYMDDSSRGFGLTGGGYYFAIDDKKDMKLLADIYTRGSWALAVESNYIKRYKYSGAFQMNYQVTKTGDKNADDYLVSKDFKVVWSHRQDAKASPNSSFSAQVNFSTSSYERQNVNNLYNPNLMAQNTKTSSVSYSRTFPEQKLTISSTFNIAQSMRDSSIAVTLPDMNISLSRLYPFKRKRAVGQERWYEKISLSYTGQLRNSITTKDDQLFKSNLVKDWKNGMSHSIPVSATFTAFKYFNITPSFNYREKWLTHKVEQEWSATDNRLMPTDTIYGFYRLYDYDMSLSLNTKLYGMYQPLFKAAKEREVMIRHVFTPQISLSNAPDFGASHYGYWETVEYIDANGMPRTQTYSPYAGQIYSPPGQGKRQSISFDVANNIEMKYKSLKDSTYRKVSIIDELGGNISYNAAADSMNWSNLNLRLRLKYGKKTFSMNAVFATYAYEFNNKGEVYVGKKTEWSYGRFGRFQGWSNSFSYTLNNDTFKKLFGKDKDKDEKDNKKGGKDSNADPNDLDSDLNDEEDTTPEKKVEKAQAGADGYQEFKMPWSFNINYRINITENRKADINPKSMRYPYKVTHNLNCGGNIKLSNKWSVTFNSGYDFEYKKITQTTFSISRDLHCWNMSASLTPFGVYKSYNFTIRASASILQDLKWEQRSQTQSNIRWY